MSKFDDLMIVDLTNVQVAYLVKTHKPLIWGLLSSGWELSSYADYDASDVPYTEISIHEWNAAEEELRKQVHIGTFEDLQEEYGDYVTLCDPFPAELATVCEILAYFGIQ